MVHRGSFDAASHRPFRWHSYPKGVGMTRLDNPDVVWWSDAGALTGIELPNLAAASSGHQGVTLGNPTFFAANSMAERCAIQLDGTNDSISIGASPYTEGYFDFRASEGHLITIPYHASFNVANDITILIKITAGDWTPGGIQTLASRWLPGTNHCWLFRLNGAGHLMYNWSLDGQATFQVQSSASVVPPADGNVWVAVAHDVNTGTGNVVRFFTSTNFSEPTSMTLLSAHTDPSTVTGIYPSTSAPIRLGSRDSNQERLYGRLRTLIVRGSINGTNIGLTNEVVRIDADIVVNQADSTIPMPVPSGHVATVDGDILRRPIGGAACFGPGESGTIILCGMIEPTQPAGARLFDSQPASMMGGQAIHITGTSGTAVTARTARAGLGTETTVAGTVSTAAPDVICLRIDRQAGLLKLWTYSGGETTTALSTTEGSSQRFTDIRIGSSNENTQYANFDFYSGAILRGAISNDDRDAIADLFLNGSDTYDDSDSWTATTPGIFDGTFYNAGDQVLALNPNVETAAGYLTPSISGASTPDAPGLDITGNVRLTAKVRKNDLTTGGFNTFSAQLTWPPNYSWRWSFFPDDTTIFGSSPNGTDFLDNSVLSAVDVAANFQAGEDFCIGLNLDFDTDTMQSLTSDDDGRTWRPIGAPVATQPFMPFNSNSPLEIGTQHGGGQHIWDGRIYWAQMESTEPRYLTATVGTVTTPDPGVPPDEFVIVADVRGPDVNASSSTIAAQWTGPSDLSSFFFLARTPAPASAIQFNYSSTGAGGGVVGRFHQLAAPGWLDGRKRVAWVVKKSTGLVRFLHSDDGVTWNVINESTAAPITIFDTAQVLRIGATTAAGALPFQGRIHSVEMHTGLDPIAGTVLWRFDANEAPTDATTTWADSRGRSWTVTNPAAISKQMPWRFDANDYPGSGTSYVDPRGRTWSVGNAAAITPLVPGLDESIPFDDVDWARVPYYATTFAAAPPAVTHFGLVEMNGPPTPHEASFFEDAVTYPYRRLDIHNYDGSLWIENAPLISGSVNIDYSRDERRSGDCEIWLPERVIGPGGLWYDKIFKFYRGLTLGPRHREPNYRGATLVWQIGSFVADRISEGSESANFKVTFRDQSKRMMLSKLIEATTFPEGTEVATVVRAVAANSGILQMLVPATGKYIGKDFTFEAGTSRWEIAKKVANDFGQELFFDHRGWLVMRPFIDPLTSPIYLYLIAKRAGLGANGKKSNVGSYDRSASDERIYNHIVVTAEGTDKVTVYRAEAENTLPNSPTSIARIGRRTLNYNSSFITSPQQCQETADALLAINALEQFTINVGTIVYPWIEVGTTIHFDEDKTEDNYPSRYLLLSATIPLGLEAMSLAGSRITIIGKADPT